MSGTTKYGLSSLYNNTGPNNSGFGEAAAFNNLDASCNTAIGANALYFNTDGPHNTAIGAGAMCNNVGGQLNTAVGSSALEGISQISVGNQNVAIGAQALYSNQGDCNVGVGCYALQNNTIAAANTAVGYQSLQTNTSGSDNTAVGYQSLQANTSGSDNTAVGSVALYSNTTGIENTAVGVESLQANTSGGGNTAVGLVSLYSNTTGTQNTANGGFSLYYNIDGSNSTAIGQSSLYSNTTGSNNTAIGNSSLYSNTTGLSNTAIGYQAGYNLSGNSNFNTFLGYQANISLENFYNYSTALGYNAIIDASNQIVLGGQNASGSYPSVKIPGSYVGIGAYNPGNSYALDVSGNTNSRYIDLSSQGDYTSNPWGVVPKQYIDDRSSGFTPITACQCATTGQIDLNNPPATIDGYTVSNDDRVLVNYQSGTNPNVANMANGIYVVSSTLPWTYASDWSSSTNTYKYITRVQNGTVNGNTQFFQTVDPGVAGTDPILFESWSAPVNLGRGLSYETTNNKTYINVDTSLNFINYLDNSAGPDNINVLNLGTNTTTVNIGNTNTIINGNVGIGKSPVYTLDVSGNINITSGATINIDTDYNELTSNPLQCGLIVMTSANTTTGTQMLKLGAYTDGTDYASAIQSCLESQGTDTPKNLILNQLGGNVGIGTTTPGYPLDVNGNANISGIVNATSFNTPSDYRIKENVTQLDSKFIVDKLNPVTYFNTKSEKQDIGLIAHELQEIFPELVNGEKDGEQFQSVNYIGLIPILIKEIQDLKDRVKILEDIN